MLANVGNYSKCFGMLFKLFLKTHLKIVPFRAGGDIFRLGRMQSKVGWVLFIILLSVPLIITTKPRHPQELVDIY